jgi:urea transporter
MPCPAWVPMCRKRRGPPPLGLKPPSDGKETPSVLGKIASAVSLPVRLLFPFLCGTARGLLMRSIARVPICDFFVNAALRSVSQVFFMNNPLSGFIIWVALAALSPLQYALLTATSVVTANLVAKLCQFPPGDVRAGLYGFSSMLVGAGLSTFLSIDLGELTEAAAAATAAVSQADSLLSDSLSSVVTDSSNSAASKAAAQASKSLETIVSSASGAALGGFSMPSSVFAAADPGKTSLFAAVILAALGGLLAAVLTRALVHSVGFAWKLPALTLPFNLIIAMFLLAIASVDPQGRTGIPGEPALSGTQRWFYLAPGVGAHPAEAASLTALDALALAQITATEALLARNGGASSWIGLCSEAAKLTTASRASSLSSSGPPTPSSSSSSLLVLARSNAWGATQTDRSAHSFIAFNGSMYALTSWTGSASLKASALEQLHNSSTPTMLALPTANALSRIPGTALCVNESLLASWWSHNNASDSLALELATHSAALNAVGSGKAGLGYGLYWGGSGAAVLLATLRGISQVYFCPRWEAGFIIFLSLAICSPVGAIVALTGSFLGTLTSIALGAPSGAVSLGLWGFNSALTSIALGGVFYVLEETSVISAAIATMMTAMVTGAIQSLFAPFGLATFTMPFVITTYVFLLLRWPRNLPLSKASVAEANMQFRLCPTCFGLLKPKKKKPRGKVVPVMVPTANGRLATSSDAVTHKMASVVDDCFECGEAVGRCSRDCACGCGLAMFGSAWPGKWSRRQGWRLRWYCCRDCIAGKPCSGQAYKESMAARAHKAALSARRREALGLPPKDSDEEKDPDATDSDSEGDDGRATGAYDYETYRKTVGSIDERLYSSTTKNKADDAVGRRMKQLRKERRAQRMAAGHSVSSNEEESDLPDDDEAARIIQARIAAEGAVASSEEEEEDEKFTVPPLRTTKTPSLTPSSGGKPSSAITPSRLEMQGGQVRINAGRSERRLAGAAHPRRGPNPMKRAQSSKRAARAQAWQVHVSVAPKPRASLEQEASDELVSASQMPEEAAGLDFDARKAMGSGGAEDDLVEDDDNVSVIDAPRPNE